MKGSLTKHPPAPNTQERIPHLINRRQTTNEACQANDKIIKDMKYKITHFAQKELKAVQDKLVGAGRNERVDWVESVYNIIEKTSRHAKSCGFQRVPPSPSTESFGIAVSTATRRISQIYAHRRLGKHLVRELKVFAAEYERIALRSCRSGKQISSDDRNSFSALLRMLSIGIPIQNDATPLEY